MRLVGETVICPQYKMLMKSSNPYFSFSRYVCWGLLYYIQWLIRKILMWGLYGKEGWLIHFRGSL